MSAEPIGHAVGDVLEEVGDVVGHHLRIEHVPVSEHDR